MNNASCGEPYPNSTAGGIYGQPCLVCAPRCPCCGRILASPPWGVYPYAWPSPWYVGPTTIHWGMNVGGEAMVVSTAANAAAPFTYTS